MTINKHGIYITGSSLASARLVFLLNFLVCLFFNLNQSEIKRAGKTSSWKWPVDLDYYESSDGRIFFSNEQAIPMLGLNQEISRRGYTRVDKFLAGQGKDVSFSSQFYRLRYIELFSINNMKYFIPLNKCLLINCFNEIGYNAILSFEYVLLQELFSINNMKYFIPLNKCLLINCFNEIGYNAILSFEYVYKNYFQ